jgi:hypothetical protein
MSTPHAKRRNDDFAALAGKLTAELQQHIAALKVVPYQGGGRTERRQRYETVSRLFRVATIVEGERQLRVEAGSKELVDGASGGTSLWENGEEVALRSLVEGAKVNLLLRLVEDHVEGLLKSRMEDPTGDFAAEAPLGEAGDSQVAPAPPLPPGLSTWAALESASATVFTVAWAHREGIQICDHSLIGRVLAKAMLVVLALAEKGTVVAGEGASNGGGGGGGGAANSAPPASGRPALATLVLRWLAALGGGPAVAAVGDKLVSSLGAAGVWALLPLFLVAVGGQASSGASEGGGGGEGGGSSSASPGVALPPRLGGIVAECSRVASEDVLRGCAGAAALMACETWAATVRPVLLKEADMTVVRLAEDAGVMEAEGGLPPLLDAASRGPGLALRTPHGEALVRVKRYLLETLLVDARAVGSLEAAAGGRPTASGAVSAAGKKLVRPILDYADWHSRMAKK